MKKSPYNQLLRVRLHVTEMKSYPGIKPIVFHPGIKFKLKENFPLSIKTYNKIYQFFSVIEISISNHMFKREIWDKFTEFTFLKF